LGRIVAVTMDREALASPDPYACLRMAVHLEDSTYGVIGEARGVGERGEGMA
jgi:K+/H+ antiporter YhaU regulatory subunit KhtT